MFLVINPTTTTATPITTEKYIHVEEMERVTMTSCARTKCSNCLLRNKKENSHMEKEKIRGRGGKERVNACLLG